MPYFYETKIEFPLYHLSEETSRHCIQVLRMKPGERLQITDGNGNLFTATIMDDHKKKCQVKIDNAAHPQQQTIKISIAISLLKNPSRFEWFVEKSAEIGVTEIIPLVCEHTTKERLRYDRVNNILISAMLQSKQTWLTRLRPSVRFEQFVSEPYEGKKLIAHCADGTKQSIIGAGKTDQTLILIGPEGDFSKAEIETAIEKSYIPVSLGNTRLRSETAGVVAAALLRNAEL